MVLLFVLPLYVFTAGLVAIPHAVLTRSPALIYRLGRFGIRLSLAIAGIQVVVRGRENLPPDPHFIYMMNHVSNLDGPVLFLHLPGEVKALGKKEVFKLPVLSTAMKLAGFIPLDRANRQTAIEGMRLAAASARRGASFLVAPEGTRSRDGRLLPFKKGGFLMAIDSGVPILPISVRGAFERMPSGSFAIQPGTIELVFHKPVPTSGLAPEDRDRLMAEVRSRIESGLEEA